MKLPFALLVLLGFGWCCPLPSSALDFTLHSTHIHAEALTLDGTYITDGKTKVMLRIPPDWRAADSPAALELIPKQPSSTVRLAQVSGVQTLAFDAAGQAELLKRSTAEVSSGAKSLEALPLVENLVPVNHWTSLEFAYRYVFFGQKMRTSVLYVNMKPGTVVTLKVVAPEEVFDEVHNQARIMLSSWFEPENDLPPGLAREYETGADGKPLVLPPPNNNPLR